MATQAVSANPAVEEFNPFQMVEFRCAGELYTVQEYLIEDDWLRRDQVERDGLNPRFAAGWRVFFSYIGNPYMYKFDTVVEYFQLFGCMMWTGSKTWGDALSKIPAAQYCSNLREAIDWLDSLTAPNVTAENLLNELKQTFMPFSLCECQKEGPDASVHMRFVEEQAPSVRALSLAVVPPSLLDRLTGLFTSLCAVSLTAPQPRPVLHSLLQRFGQLQRLDMKISAIDNFSLELLENCTRLQCVTIDGLGALSPFINPQLMGELQQLALTNVTANGSLTSICRLPKLQELNLANARVEHLHKSVEALSCIATLTSLNLQNLRPVSFLRECLLGPLTHKDREYHSYLIGPSHALLQARPALRLSPPMSLADNRQFDQVILRPGLFVSGPYIFSAQEVDFIPLLDLRSLLMKVCAEHENWPAEVACQDENLQLNNGYPISMYVPYDYNLPPGPYINASVITSFDGRKRIATQEPLSLQARCRFWSMVEETNVSLIVRAREHANDSYFPIDPQKPKVFGTLSIELQETIEITKNATLRKLKVGSRIVSHLQINWLDNDGFNDMQELLTILERIEAIERDTPLGATGIHCGAGVGRTGTIFGALFMFKRHRELNARALFNLEALLYGLRQWRMWMIITDSQLKTLLNLFKYLQSFVVKG